MAAMFEGLFSPWHLVIIAAVVFLVFGPRRLARRWDDLRHGVERLASGDASTPEPSSEHQPAPDRRRSGVAYRLGRLFHRGR